MLKIDFEEARGEFDELLYKVADTQERVAIKRDSNEIAYLVGKEDMKLIRFIEDMIDQKAAYEALIEGGENLSFDDLMKELGL